MSAHSGIRVTVPCMDELVGEHPCRFKPIYYASYVTPVIEALKAVGLDPRPADRVERGVIVRFTFPDGRRVGAIVDYADQTHVDGLVRYADGEFDFVFKMKPCERHAAEYDAAKWPILPWGYLIAPANTGEPADCDEERRWFVRSLGELRKIQDRAGHADGLMTRGSFHAMHHCVRRRQFFDAAYFQGEKWEVPFRQHMEDVARAGALLSLSGPDETIDRKVVEALAIGVPLVSDDGILDLMLPWGGRFVDGENVYIVRTVNEVRLVAAEGLPPQTRARLREGQRALYARSFDPQSIGLWMLKCAMEFVA